MQRQSRVRQPGRRRRPASRRDRARPRLGRRDRRAAVGPRASARPGSPTGSTPPSRCSSWPAATPPRPGRRNVEFLHGTIEQIPLERRVGRRRHLELRHRAVRRQGRHVRRDRPGAAPGRSRRDQRHRPRRARRRHTDHRLVRRRRDHARRLRGRLAPRRARPRRGHADRCDRCRAVQRHHPRGQAGDVDPPDARRGLAGGAGHLRGRDRHRQRHVRDRGAELGALGREHLADHRLVATVDDGRGRVGRAEPGVGPLRVRRRGREQRLHPPGPPWSRRRHRPARRPRRPAPSAPATGRSRPASSRRTRPASRRTSGSGSGSSAAASASASSTGVWRDTLLLERRSTRI